ncbi:WcaF family extracellular polysaccharide biosynthesis acetyltransferase [Henriciella sp.]|uniref:WcaF family extracellular polysaccharide biosynthesis acetyltransferase n=1 Tax=Henriciella sp. TaxID=1968823 RepID=UPI001852D25A|nr:colanic acid biosynthesis acetyltransferase WcaF [Henriciella sp.]
MPPIHESTVQLANFDNKSWDRGRSRLIEFAWLFLSSLFISSSIPGSLHRKLILQAFGAEIGRGVVIKPRTQIKFPWRLSIGAHSWIGEGVWIDNLAQVEIGSNACISQDAYLCTGSHDWSSRTFDLIVKPIVVGDAAWVAARATVGPGVTIGEGAVLGLGATASRDLQPWKVYFGNPAVASKLRTLRG